MSNRDDNGIDDTLPPLEDMPDQLDEEIDGDENTVSNFSRKKALIKNKVTKITGVIYKRFSTLKQKKYWIPLVVGHALMFSGMGYFVYLEETHKRSIDYVLQTMDTVLETKDPALLTQILNPSIFIDNTHATIQSGLELSPDFAIYIGEVSDVSLFNDNMSSIFLSLVRGDDIVLSFDQELNILPANLASQFRKTPFIVNKELSDPDANTYILETTLSTVKWGNYPLQLTAHLEDDVWNITEITNLQGIMAQYDGELAKNRMDEENYIANNKLEIANMVNRYLPNPVCFASITELSGQQILIIRIETEANNMDKDMYSWSVDTDINFENGNLFMEKYLKINKIFHPTNSISNSWNITLTDKEIAEIAEQKLVCNATPVMVNLPDGEFYQITK